LPVKDVMELKAGDIIPFDMPDEVTLIAEDIPVFRGEYGMSNGNRAIKIKEVIKLEELKSSIA
jgi:flagellar motor switch protein FliM